MVVLMAVLFYGYVAVLGRSVLWASAGLVAIPVLLYYGGGYVQYGFRYSLDVTPFLIALVALVAAYRDIRDPQVAAMILAVAAAFAGLEEPRAQLWIFVRGEGGFERARGLRFLDDELSCRRRAAGCRSPTLPLPHSPPRPGMAQAFCGSAKRRAPLRS